MNQLRFTREARVDLNDLFDYISRDKPRAAIGVVSRIEKKCRLLARRPMLGTPCDELSPGLRQTSVGTYVIYYRISPDGIEVIRVVSGFRDLVSLFG